MAQREGMAALSRHEITGPVAGPRSTGNATGHAWQVELDGLDPYFQARSERDRNHSGVGAAR